MTAAEPETVHTFCRYCLAACGIEVTVEDNRVTKISADKQNPHSWQDFCAKGRTANQLVEHPRRILNPMRRVGDTYVEASWDEAIGDIAARMTALIDADGPDAVGALLRQSVRLLVVEHRLHERLAGRRRHPQPVLRRLGRPERDARRRRGDVRVQLMAPVSDIDNCDYFLLVGTNPGCQRVELAGDRARRLAARAGPAEARARQIVVVDPLRTETAEKADVHLAVRPGQDWALLLAMVKVILDEGLEHARTAANSPPGWRNCARSSPTPTSTTWPRDATSPEPRSSRWPGTSPPHAARWW